MAHATSSQSIRAFLDDLPAGRRREIERMRKLVRQNLPAGYEEVVSRNMLVYQVPLERYADTYNGQPLWYIALASEKKSLSLHLMRVYADAAQRKRLENAFTSAGKKLNMGKACVRFQSADDLPLDAIADVVASTPVDRWVAIAESARRRGR